MDEVTFLIRLISDNWPKACVDDGNVGGESGDATANDGKNSFGDNLPGIAQHRAQPLIIDIRSIEAQRGRRVDADSQDIMIIYEDSASISHPTIDWAVRNEDYTFTIHIRTLQPKGQSVLTFSRDRLESLYRITRYIIEKKGLRPKVLDENSAVEADAELIEITGRSEANDRGKRLLGYKLSVTMKRFGRAIVS